MEMKDRLNRWKHPFFEHGEAEYFLACRGDKIVGHVAAFRSGVLPGKIGLDFFHELVDD